MSHVQKGGVRSQGLNAALLLAPADEHHADRRACAAQRGLLVAPGETWAAGADRPDSSGQLDACVSEGEIGECDMHSTKDATWNPREKSLIILGLILTVVGVLVGIPVLYIIGIILLVIGVILALFGLTGRAIGGRRYYF